MNEFTKQKLVFGMACIAFLMFLGGCRTAPGTVVPNNSGGAGQVRDDLAGITSGQTELAITGEGIKNTGDNLENAVNGLEQSIISGTGQDGSFEEILREVRKRPLE